MAQMMQLRPYQADGAAWLASQRAGLLADDCGLGKTAQAIAACDAAEADSVVVVCPASVVENWRREFAKFSARPRDLRVYSYEKVQKAEMPETFDVLVVDEAHMAKSATARRTRFLFGEKCDGSGLVARAGRVMLLTATPMPNAPNEMWPALRALAPEVITGTSGKPWSYWQFVQKYCKTRDNGFGLQIVGAKNHDALKQALAPFMLRRLKSEVAGDLPPITFGEVYLEGKIDVHTEMKEGSALIDKVLREEGVEGLKSIAHHVATLRRLTGLAKVKPVVDWVKDWFNGGGGKLVLFAHHREVVEALWYELRDLEVVTLTGGSSQAKRVEVIDDFQGGGAKVFIGQLQAAGTGITLTASSDVLFVESSWVPAENSQAAMRVHRIGQKNACTVRFAMLAGSIDEQIQRAVARKTADITRIMD